MAVVVQDCRGAGAAEDDDHRCHHGGRLLLIMWSIDSEFIQRIAVFESAEPSQATSVQPCLRPRHRSQAYRRQSVHMLKCRRDGCWFKGRNHPTIARARLTVATQSVGCREPRDVLQVRHRPSPRADHRRTRDCQQGILVGLPNLLRSKPLVSDGD